MRQPTQKEIEKFFDNHRKIKAIDRATKAAIIKIFPPKQLELQLHGTAIIQRRKD